MHYAAIVNGEEREVEVTELSPGHYRIEMNGRVLELDVRAISDTTMSVLSNGQAYDIEFERNPKGGDNLLLRGNVVQVEVLDLRRLRLRRTQAVHGAQEGPAEVASPMPGKVVAVLVEEGQEVQAGEGVLVVEAMKMENELKAPRAGVVRNLVACEGEAVEGNATLCVIE